MAISPI